MRTAIYPGLSQPCHSIMSVVLSPAVGTCLANWLDQMGRLAYRTSWDRSTSRSDGRNRPIWSVAFAPMDNCLRRVRAAARSARGTCAEPDKAVPPLLHGERGSVWSVRFYARTANQVARVPGRGIRIRDLTGKDVMELRAFTPDESSSVSFGPGMGNFLASGSPRAGFVFGICLLNGRYGHAISTRPDLADYFRPPRRHIASGSVDRSSPWNLGLERLGGCSAGGPIRGLAFSRRDDWARRGSCSDGTVRAVARIGRDDFATLLTRAKSDRERGAPRFRGRFLRRTAWLADVLWRALAEARRSHCTTLR